MGSNEHFTQPHYCSSLIKAIVDYPTVSASQHSSTKIEFSGENLFSSQVASKVMTPSPV